MWKLNEIYAKNLCSFKELEYQILQGHTTLVFGNNMDNDSQGSNGSGKSAMLEAIAIGLTGESLRKVKMDEIISDSEDYLIVSTTLSNDSTGDILYVKREFSRKSPQDINIVLTQPNEQPKKIILSGVADYNKYVLDTLGLTKDDIYSNFILSKHKYTSFLSSSDREKKEIINRFSNGLIVDDSIAALQVDMVPVEESLKTAETNVAVLTGKIDTLTEQIEISINEQAEKTQKKAERIKLWKQAIAQKRELIRSLKDDIERNDNILDKYDEIDGKIQDLEEDNKSLKESYETISKLFEYAKLSNLSDYNEISHQYNCALKDLEDAHIKLSDELSAYKIKVKDEECAYKDVIKQHESFLKSYTRQSSELQEYIDELIKNIKDTESEIASLNRKRLCINNDIAELHKLLAGVITCPSCKHQFTIANNIDIEHTRLDLQNCEEKINKLVNTISQKEADVTNNTANGKQLRIKQNCLEQSKADWELTVRKATLKYDSLKSEGDKIVSQIQDVEQRYTSLKKRIENSKRDLFDEAYNVIDSAVKVLENSLKQLELDIENAKGSIQSYEESIKEAENATSNDMISNMRESKVKYEQELDYAKLDKRNIEEHLSKLKVQESTFVEFKTHLANSKIDALSQITNEFLEAIGSDIRISFSGFTVLKSGKVRDKISISLLRDGIDCGSYDKFSEGEKTRVNLASILAMHKLTNINCDDDKGLDLLVLDEILEATDEQGLANIFDALNQLQITSLVVSHGSTAENYPYKTVVNKLNGVSFINGKK